MRNDLTVTKRFEFCYGHQLPYHDGRCQNRHGHNAVLEIEVEGPVISEGPKVGMIIDFGDLKKIVQEDVIKELDHQWLNDFFDNPTAENIVVWIYDLLKGRLPELRRIRLYETPDSYCEWKK